MTEEFDKYKRRQAAAWLESVAKLREHCAALQTEIDDVRQSASGLSGMDYSAPAVSKSPSADSIPNAVVRIQSLISDYCTELASSLEERKKAHDALARMEDKAHASALRRHYLAGQPWELVCVEMGYSWDGMMKLRRRALVEAYDVMPVDRRDPMHPAV